MNRTLKRQVSHLDSLPLSPTTILGLLGHNHSHGMGKEVTKIINFLSQAYLLVNVDQKF